MGEGLFFKSLSINKIMKNSISNIKKLHLDSDGTYKIAAEHQDFAMPTTFSFPAQSVNRYDVVYGETAPTIKPPRITNTERLQAERNSQLSPVAWLLTRDKIMAHCVVVGIIGLLVTNSRMWALCFVPPCVGLLLAMLDWQRGDRERWARNVAEFESYKKD